MDCNGYAQGFDNFRAETIYQQRHVRMGLILMDQVEFVSNQAASENSSLRQQAFFSAAGAVSVQ